MRHMQTLSSDQLLSLVMWRSSQTDGSVCLSVWEIVFLWGRGLDIDRTACCVCVCQSTVKYSPPDYSQHPAVLYLMQLFWGRLTLQTPNPESHDQMQHLRQPNIPSAKSRPTRRSEKRGELWSFPLSNIRVFSQDAIGDKKQTHSDNK